MSVLVPGAYVGTYFTQGSVQQRNTPPPPTSIRMVQPLKNTTFDYILAFFSTASYIPKCEAVEGQGYQVSNINSLVCVFNNIIYSEVMLEAACSLAYLVLRV